MSKIDIYSTFHLLQNHFSAKRILLVVIVSREYLSKRQKTGNEQSRPNTKWTKNRNNIGAVDAKT